MIVGHLVYILILKIYYQVLQIVVGQIVLKIHGPKVFKGKGKKAQQESSQQQKPTRLSSGQEIKLSQLLVLPGSICLFVIFEL